MNIFSPPKSHKPYSRGHEIYNLSRGLYILFIYAVSIYSVQVKVNEKVFKHYIHLHYMTTLADWT